MRTIEYYSAIKRNKTVSFEDISRDLETVIQNEVSQKGKNKYINAYMWSLEKMVPMNLFVKQKKTQRCRKQVYGRQGVKVGWNKLGDWDWHIYTTLKN